MLESLSLDGKTIVVTGGGTGLGKEMVLAMARAGADTVVALGTRILGKPRDESEAVEMLSTLAGQEHLVYTGVALARPPGEPCGDLVVSSRVRMRTSTQAELEAYVARGESLDKAGGYALQGEGRRLVTGVEGSETNVIGLPVEETLALLARAFDETAT